MVKNTFFANIFWMFVASGDPFLFVASGFSECFFKNWQKTWTTRPLTWTTPSPPDWTPSPPNQPPTRTNQSSINLQRHLSICNTLLEVRVWGWFRWKGWLVQAGGGGVQIGGFRWEGERWFSWGGGSGVQVGVVQVRGEGQTLAWGRCKGTKGQTLERGEMSTVSFCSLRKLR